MSQKKKNTSNDFLGLAIGTKPAIIKDMRVVDKDKTITTFFIFLAIIAFFLAIPLL